MNRPLVMMVTGTGEFAFDRVVGWVDAWAARNPQVEVVVQYGASTPPEHATGHRLIPHAELQRLVSAATVVITHGGPGSIMDVVRGGRQPLAVPRDPELNEVVDHHQQRFVRALAGAGLYRLCESQAELLARLEEALADPSVLDCAEKPELDVARSVERVKTIIGSYLPRTRTRTGGRP